MTLNKLANAIRAILRPYQADMKRDIYAAWDAGVRNVLAVLPTGAGKTVTFSDIIHDHVGASCAIAHRQELVSQISLALARDGVRHRIIGPTSIIKLCVSQHMAELGVSYYNPNAECAVAGVDTLVRRAEELKGWLNSVTLWVLDECFPAGTLVDGRPIETIKVGEYVTAFNEKTGGFESRRVERLFKNKAPKHMVRLTIGHHVLECTEGHPIWTKRGWINAKDITGNDSIVCNVQKTCRLDRVSPGSVSRYGARLLQSRLFKDLSGSMFIKDNGENEQEIRIGKNEKQQPDEERRKSCKNVKHAAKDWSRTKNKRWERKTTNRSRIETARVVQSFRLRVANHSENRGSFVLPYSLQNRLRKPSFNDCNRSRRIESSRIESQRTGCEEGQIFKWQRVDSVQIFESSDLEHTGNSSFDGFVYNIEVEGLHTYVANDVVVHNCHHQLVDNKWGTAAAMFPNAKGLGVTATPLRADGKGLGQHADGLFELMIVGPSMRDLINQGYLTDYRVFAPPSDLDLSEVTTGASGEFSGAKLKKAVRKSHVVGDVVKHYLRIAKGKLGVTFATDVETATDIAAQFNAAGVPAAVVSANTKASVRVALVQQFKRRELLQLVNVDLFGEGFDLPAIEVVSMARPTQSYALYVQQFGRALRLLDGKEWAIIIDHVGNVERHGLPDAPRTWTLDRREKRGKSAVSDVIPTRTCLNPECVAVYERIHKACPYCGHVPVPAGRSLPEQVDGDLIELDAEALARMRGEVSVVDMDQNDYYAVLRSKHVPDIGIKPALKRHVVQQESQAALRHSMAWWGGYHRSKGMEDSEIYRRFYFKYGIDMLSAQTLKTKEALPLAQLINEEMGTWTDIV